MEKEVLSQHFSVDINTVTRDIAGEIIIVPVKNHVANLESVYTLNELGSEIWRQLDGKTSVSQIIDSIVINYEVSWAVAAADVEEFLQSLLQAGLVVCRKRGEQ